MKSNTNTSNPYGRSDLHTIARWIPDGSRVLDLGCGNGDFLKTLKQEKQVTGYGIELDAEKIRTVLQAASTLFKPIWIKAWLISILIHLIL